MPSMRDATARAELLGRLDQLRPESKAQWGKMTAAQMLAHLSDALRMSLGDLHVEPKNVPIARFWPVKQLMLHVLPFPKNAPTADELKSREPVGFEEEREALRQLLVRMDPASGSKRASVHPIFGAMTLEDWGALGYKHFDHHLRQFGV
jgi:Protein of unknown function (DUF1569)